MEENTTQKLAVASFISIDPDLRHNPWNTPQSVDRLEYAVTLDKKEETFKKTVEAARFFYNKDPIVSTVINKMVEIGITDLVMDRKNLNANETRIVEALLDELKEFAESMALEYLLSGLVVPEIDYSRATKEELNKFGIKRYQSLMLPTTMWLRDPMTMKVNSSLVLDKPSYFIEIPPELIHFIQNKGEYGDGTSDKELYKELVDKYPEFVREVQEKGSKYFLIKNNKIFRRRPITGNQYPSVYLSSIIELLRHKRNLRRMDYSIAARAIAAIQLFKLGNDDFPITEDQEDAFTAIKDQMDWRQSGKVDVERIFQLFANHTLTVEWIYPPLDALLDEKKYSEINQDIVTGLGFPRILMTGEALRTGTSDAEFASLSPISTMESFRKKILKVLNSIVDTVIEKNNLRGSTQLRFTPINLRNFSDFIEALSKLYETGSLSKKTFADAFGYTLEEELEQRSEEKKLLDSLNLDEFPQQPFTPSATNNTSNTPNKKSNTPSTSS